MFLQMEKKETTSQAPITRTRRATSPIIMVIIINAYKMHTQSIKIISTKLQFIVHMA